MEPLSVLEKKLGYTFKNKALLSQALIHPSIAGDGRRESNNQRLEYLGDAVVELAVSQYLYNSLTLKEGGYSFGGSSCSGRAQNRPGAGYRYERRGAPQRRRG